MSRCIEGMSGCPVDDDTVSRGRSIGRSSCDGSVIGTRAPESLIDDDGAVGTAEKEAAANTMPTPNGGIDERGNGILNAD